jgi:Spy/CpxP family protein refolding chaperone
LEVEEKLQIFLEEERIVLTPEQIEKLLQFIQERMAEAQELFGAGFID